MVRNRWPEMAGPDLQTLLDALDDEACREIVRHVDSPMTATQISDTCDIPLSTTYRKLDLLTEATMLEERTEIRPDGHHTSRYVRNFDVVTIGLTDGDEFEVAISRPPEERPEERLASLWDAIREEV